MNNLKIRELCLSQCNIYYEYIKQFTEHHGKTVTSVHSINQLDDTLYEIKLEKPIFNFDTTYFKNNISGEYYFNNKDLLVKEYDHKNKLLYLKIIKEDLNFSELQAHQFFVINDLLFLITNLIEWYDKHGKTLGFTNTIPLIENYTLDNLYDTTLNDNQREAINTIFNNTYSYIWGPPGTGKTRAVLSCSIINYIKSDKKVLIVAPTNVALEQILYGIIENTEKLGISKNKFLRVGVPSKKFVEKHSEICEVRGLEHEISLIENELKILNKVIKFREGKEITSDLENINYLLADIIDFKENIKNYEAKKEDLQPLLNLITQPLKKYHFSNNSKIIKDAIFKRKDNSCVNYNEKLIEENKLHEVVNINCLRNEIKRIDNKINEISKQILDILNKAKSFTKSQKIYNEIFKDLDDDNIQDKRNLIIKKINDLNNWSIKWKNNIENIAKLYNDDLINEALDEHHKNFEMNRLIKRIKEIEFKRNALLEQTTKLRIQGSQIIAMTIDAYIQYTLKDSITADHIFCDEAGYMSNIKAITLFRNKCPITFLGDHMQLPPVSEVRNDDLNSIQKTFLWSQSSIFFESIFIQEYEKDLLDEYLNKITPTYKIAQQTNLNFTHRFGNNLAQVLDKFVYKFGFKSASQNSTEIISIHTSSNPIEVYERSNQWEVDLIKNFILNEDIKDFAVLTPYNKQVQLLKKNLDRKYYENIMTIHKSQGSEWDTVIFSVVDDSPAGSGKRGAFFTNSLNHKFNSLNLINTVVSRAKKRLIIVSNENFWLRDVEKQLIGNLIKISNNKYIRE
ncbi:DNA helicase [Malaciobacter pacificus]|uniref:ATP-binding protein (AAA domain) n=1 Tax=Malaciobacter pacificus TaxID=1080223 RepID=A0A5C2HCC4_9BACT|nr:AAA domain-containing protein [Malaciobacter pacificus]QEP34464.1 ATP-binding protein (AAA domain) [Malaciobacter pacificus]GGD34350.1 DNA helicase [Malaciobacter pacificus]